MTGPNRSAAGYPYFDNGGLPIAFAHRGGALTGSNVGLENSMIAFESAIALGYRYIETDVHATADGELLAFHDRTLDRSTDRSGTIAELGYDEVRNARIAGRVPIPRLRDVLATWPELHLNVDAKSVGALKPLARVIQEERAWDRVCVASFSPRRLHRLRRLLGPRVASCLATWEVAALRYAPSTRLRHGVLRRAGQAAQVPIRAGRIEVVTPGFVDRAHRLGRVVQVWTIDEPEEMHRLLDLGVDAIMTDRTDVLKDVYEARGVWGG
ncbi:MAG: glycerophosphodiester phosphodiesterase family protein [Nocardioidaceae bacterium]